MSERAWNQYVDGQQAMVGDIILCHRDYKALVLELIEPGTSASADYSLPEGGVMYVALGGEMFLHEEGGEDVKISTKGDLFCVPLEQDHELIERSSLCDPWSAPKD